MTTPTVPRFDTPPDAEALATVTITVAVPRRISTRPGFDAERLADALGRICDLATPMLAEGVTPETLIKKITPREYSRDWPPPEPQP